MADPKVSIPCPVCSARVKVAVRVAYHRDSERSALVVSGVAEHACAEKP